MVGNIEMNVKKDNKDFVFHKRLRVPLPAELLLALLHEINELLCSRVRDA
jgi:hypothetical protein